MDTNGSTPSPRRRAVRKPAAGREAALAIDLAEGAEPGAADGAVQSEGTGSGAAAGPGSATAPPGARVPKATVPARPAAPGASAGPVASGEEPGSDWRGSDDGSASHAEIRKGISLSEATLASVELHRGAIGRLDAQDVDIHFGAIGAARADDIQIQLGSVGAALANELKVTQGSVGTVLTSNAHLERAVVRTMVARTVRVERPSLIGILVARRVSGDVRVLLDWRGGLVFGVLFGLIARFGRRR